MVADYSTNILPIISDFKMPYFFHFSKMDEKMADNVMIEEANIIGQPNQPMELGLTPLQIQQEYFENLGDFDGIRYNTK